LFYITRGPKMVAVPIALNMTPQIGQPVTLFALRAGAQGNPGMYDVTPDGRRFLINTRLGDDVPPAALIVMQHFDNELRAALEHRE